MRFKKWLMRQIPPVLQESSFRRYWIGRSLSMVGGQISMLAFPLTAVLVLHVTPETMGFLTAIGALPSLLLSIQVGAWVDRYGRRRQVMIGSDLGRALLLAWIPLAVGLHLLNVPLLGGIWLLAGVCSVFFRVASGTLFVALVPRDQYAEANGILQQSQAMAFLVGPAIAGWLIQIFSAPLALLADALSFLASAASLARIYPTEPPVDDVGNHKIGDGMRFIRLSPVLRSMLVSQLVQGLFRAIFMSVYILYATRELGVTPAEWGIILGPSSVLALIGSSLAGRITRKMGLGPTLILGTIFVTIPLLAVPLVEGPHLFVLAVLFVVEGLAGAGSMIRGITTATVQAVAIPDSIRARVMAAFSIVGVGTTPVGALLAAILAWRFGVLATLWVATIGMSVAFVGLLVPEVFRLRHSEELAVQGTP